MLHDDLGRSDRRIACAGIVAVTARLPEDDLWQALEARGDVQQAGIKSLRRIGDCYAPGLIAAAVYQGHRYARELERPPDPDGVPFRRERHLMEAT